jgi:hypothetical protein
MENQPAAAIYRGDDLRLVRYYISLAMMLSRFISIGHSIASAEQENGSERDNGSHQHGVCPSLDGTFD